MSINLKGAAPLPSIGGNAVLLGAADGDASVPSPISAAVLLAWLQSQGLVTGDDIDAAVSNAVSALIDSAPATLDTLNELAASIGDDANFAGTMATALTARLGKNFAALTAAATLDGTELVAVHDGVDAKKVTVTELLAVAATGGGGIPAAIIEDQKTAGTAGGSSSSGAWHTRDLNTLARNDDSVISLSSNEFTPSVDGFIVWRSPFFKSDAVRTRLYNVTAAAEIVKSISASASYAYAGGCYSVGCTSVSANTAYRIEYYTQTSQATNGLGITSSVAGGGTEQYTQVLFWRS